LLKRAADCSDIFVLLHFIGTHTHYCHCSETVIETRYAQVPFIYAMVYKYRTLDGQSIRLLRLLPGDDLETIQCSLEPCTLDAVEHIDYEAISYTWGILGHSASIKLEGFLLPIQANLHAFLRVLQLRNTPRILWVDAICIDQNDVQDKNVQVPLMEKIYSRASKVLVWLGPHRDGSELVFDFCNQSERPPPGHELYSPTKATHDIEGMRSGDVISDAIEALFYREYWQRSWIIQEVLLARRLTIHCGNSNTSWESLVAARDWLLGHRPVRMNNLSDDPFEQTHFGAFDDLCEQRKSKQSTTLELCLFRFGGRNCTNIRDRIYGLLGVANDKGKLQELRVDYSICTEELFFQVMNLYPSRAPIHFCLCLMKVLNTYQGECLSWARSVLSQHRPHLEKLQLTNPIFLCQLRYSGLLEYNLLDKFSQSTKSQHNSKDSTTCPVGRTQALPDQEQESLFEFVSALERHKISTFRSQSFKRWGKYRMDLSTKASVRPADAVYHFSPTDAALIYRWISPTQQEFVGFAINTRHLEANHEAVARDLEASAPAMTGLGARLQISASSGIEDEVEVRLSFLELITICTKVGVGPEG
jgi:Heterokaryon incompatibility protein (HET)